MYEDFEKNVFNWCVHTLHWPFRLYPLGLSFTVEVRDKIKGEPG